MSQSLPHDEIKSGTRVSLEEILNTRDDSDIGYFKEVDLRHPYNRRQKVFPFHPEKKTLIKVDFNERMKKSNQKNIYHIKKIVNGQIRTGI